MQSRREVVVAVSAYVIRLVTDGPIRAFDFAGDLSLLKLGKRPNIFSFPVDRCEEVDDLRTEVGHCLQSPKLTITT